MKIKGKLILLVSLLIAGLLITGVLASFELKKTEEANHEIQEKQEIQLILKSLQYRFTGISNDERAFLLTGDMELVAGIEEKTKEIKTHFDELEGNPNLNGSEIKAINQMKENLSVYGEANKEMVETYLNGDHEKAKTIHMEEQRGIRKELVDPSINKFIDDLTNKIESEKTLLNEKQQMAIIILYSVIILSIMSGIIFSLVIVRSIIKPLKIVHIRLREIAEGEGDLTQNIKLTSSDELGDIARSYNQMIGKLRELIKQVGEHAGQVAAASVQLTASVQESTGASEQISATVQQVAVGIDKQNQSVKETAMTINDLSTSVGIIAANSQVVNTTALQASEKALEGNKAVETVVRQMNEINDSVTSLSQEVKLLGERSTHINKIVEVITGIAEQTNLLALNAAIEAARAGEHGRGFAVVADEVRKLAEQSASSAEQISTVISSILKDTNQTVQSMDDTTNKVAAGISLVHHAGSSFDQIQQGVVEVSSQIQEVTSAVQEMYIGTEQIVQAIKVIDETSNLTATSTDSMSGAVEKQLASMEEITASSAALSKMAEELQELIGKFKV
ncbi:methyl-accepting chemotaxis protein [uncultured Metabacillus sp.]|uniref:methyl-accepting chemotaxis protein n=1 Tax=uncultured Metabacillus sp. TaxID=2860135 RepID=UPI0026174128|nr:HAMP domain-containing methyl-accepting chemotaxis protein [uncultured Metabacillus sp.]